MDEPLPEQGPLRILIADDSESDRLILAKLVERQGHEVVGARDGLEAVEQFRDHDPHLVLLDVMMPRLDGMEAARQIKVIAGERLVPVIFLTSISDAPTLAKCLESGGDDFLSKPYNRVILEAKINAFNRMRLMHRTLSHQRDLIRDRNRLLLSEQKVAKRVFDNVAHTGCLDAPNLRYHASPLSIFNGDVLFACPRPAGGMHVLIGDFTGHGLPAAIGAMPMAEIFYGMTSKGFGSDDVLREINQKLKRILPTGMFCCALFIQADFHLNQLRVWNGGLPDGYLVRHNGERVKLASSHLPLGVLSSERFAAQVDVIHTEPGDALLVATDGILEAENAEGEMFGEVRLLDAMSGQTGGDDLFESVMAAVSEFTGDQRVQDDLTVFALEMVDEQLLADLPSRLPQSPLSGATEWQCEYELTDRTLGQFNPLPLLLQICMEVPGLRRRSGEVYTLLSELYSNALEHGILQLPSEWKISPEGFGQYYAERERRLSETVGHFIRFRLRHTPKDQGGRLEILCEDSGDGFDYRPCLAESRPDKRYAGRGLMLLQQLSTSLSFNDKGNQVGVVYDWKFT
ncbi:MAG: fused response regulator/phosphatase [Marinobacter sp.]|uniref:ATP-binding SpoIIE family protein phosphatase n=1 Tax=Marinobacter sp. TaxID=50741 RepID=UPI00299DD4A2|nr:fused response regulator/phosphatase [Marinobacter sp.]MDX1757577.1 fused response regulator/phosphatase [Marinobacter sp.]